MAQRFTRIPKTQYLLEQGIPKEVIPTYCCLSDYSDNKSGLCWPKMETLASTLRCSVRTIQRHLHLLHKLGVIEILQRRRYKGRFSSYLYRVLHIVASTTGHARLVVTRPLYKERTKPPMNLGEKHIDYKDQEARKLSVKRKRGAEKRKEGFEWFFG